MTPPRNKAHRITPHHHSKSQYANQNRQRDHNNNIHVNKKRQPSDAHKHEQQQSNKRHNSNPTPRKFKKNHPDNNHDNTSDHQQQQHQQQQPQLLDVTADPQVAHRVRQRQKMISKGKNTAGYAHYRKVIPLHKRKTKSLTTPSTPNPYLDCSTKRWQGLVRAWRIALHQYDPPELVQTLQAPPVLSPDEDENQVTRKSRNNNQDKELDNVYAANCQTPSKADNKIKNNKSPGDVSMKSAMSVDTVRSSRSIRICNLTTNGSGSGEDVSPCVSVLSPGTPPEAAQQRKEGKTTDARRELDTLFAKASTQPPSQKENKAATSDSQESPAKPLADTATARTTKTSAAVETKRNLTTGATGWGDDSSDEEDDDLL